MRRIRIPMIAVSLMAAGCGPAQDETQDAAAEAAPDEIAQDAFAEDPFAEEEAAPVDEAEQAEIFASEAFQHYARAFGNSCFWGEEIEAADAYPAERWTLNWDSPYGDGPQTATLYKFHCDAGAYNVSHVWYLAREFSAPEPIAFAMPAYEVEYENGDSDGAVLNVAVTGFEAAPMLVNSQFDPETMTIGSASYWRGIGDASSSGAWVFEDERFVLKTYAIDGSYDGEVNPVQVVAY